MLVLRVLVCNKKERIDYFRCLISNPVLILQYLSTPLIMKQCEYGGIAQHYFHMEI